MKYNKTGRAPYATAALMTAALLSALEFLPAAQHALAQTTATGEVQTMYSTSYPTIQADSSNSFTVQSEYRIYKPGDTVRIEGSMTSEMSAETQSDSVSIDVMNASGEVVASQETTVDNSGQYSATIALPANAPEGEYTVDSKIEVSVGVLGLLSAEVIANLESSTQFVVGSSSSFTVEAEGGEQFEIEITSSSNVSNVRLHQESMRVSFTVEILRRGHAAP